MEISQEQRNINASDNRVKALKVLSSIDFDRWVGSGFNIQITGLDGVALCPEFLVNGEDMFMISPAITNSLRNSLLFSRQSLLNKLRDLEEALGLDVEIAGD